MKKLLAFLFIFIFTNVGYANFTDVKWDTLYKDGINLLQENQIVKGYTDGSFGVDRNISRSEMLKILIESKFLVEESNSGVLDGYQNQNCFEDVNSSDWFAKYVCWAKENQWIKGYNDGKEFRPNNPVTLVEAIKMTLKSGDLDYQETDRWYKGVVDKASSHNLIPLDTDYFHYNLRRDQMADMIARLINFKQDKLDDYLKDRKDLVVSWDTLKIKDNLVNQISSDCKTPNYYRMINQTLYNFYDENQSCISIVSVYNTSLDEIEDPIYDHTFYKEMSYFTVFYKTNIQNQELVDSILESVVFYDDDQDNFEKNSKAADYHSKNGIYYLNLPSELKDFNVIEYPILTDSSEYDAETFEGQKQQWRLEAEDRFDIQSCNEYNFPAFMMFQIKTFYEYCQELREGINSQTPEDQAEQAQATLKQEEDLYCNQDPEKLDDGSLKFPIRDEYLNLGALGEIFTAFRCPNTARLNEIDNVEKYTYQKPMQIDLLNPAEPELIDLFQILGFQCKENIEAEKCSVFETKESEISVDSLFKLEGYIEKFKSAE